MTLNPSAQKVSDFLERLASDLITQQGVRVGLTDLGVFSAAKTLQKADCLPILKETFKRVVTKHPEMVDLLVECASQAVKDRIKKACEK